MDQVRRGGIGRIREVPRRRSWQCDESSILLFLARAADSAPRMERSKGITVSVSVSCMVHERQLARF